LRAREVKRIDADATLAQNARRIALVRLDELYSFAPKALDPSRKRALHDMRIAAKRLRYLLEVAEPALGPAAKRGAKEAKALQGLLGDIHDCDEMLLFVDDHLSRLRADDSAAVHLSAAADAEDLDPALVRIAPNRTRYRGVESLRTWLQARRALLHERFAERWAKLEAGGFRKKLESSLAAEDGAG
jgi:CHAD domain